MNRRGFTLIEMLVVMSVFLTLMLVVSDIFLSVSINQRKVLAEEQALMDLQFNLEEVVQKARLGRFDYDSLSLPEAPLALIMNGTDKVIFFRQENNCANGTVGCLVMKTNDQEQIISADNVDVQSFEYVLTPEQSPYIYDAVAKKYLSDQQPQALLLLKVKVRAPHAEDQKEITLQTTVSSRYYER